MTGTAWLLYVWEIFDPAPVHEPTPIDELLAFHGVENEPIREHRELDNRAGSVSKQD